MSARPSAKDQAALLCDGCVDVILRTELEARLARSLETGRPLVVKAGFDPSSPDIHLGHVVVMRKMRQFQDLGHRIVFVVGDFTAMIGDPSGRSKTRPVLSREQIVANAETYRRQATKILDDARTEFRYNSEWIEKLGASGLVRLAAKYNVARMLERRDFRQRFDSGQSIAVHEFLYPLAQAYDSVALGADVELGGTDQLFNLNVGRDIMPEYGLAPQIVMTTPLLEGLDGVEKMSKSLGNYVGVDEPPGEMFGKLMSISDVLMWKYWNLLTGAPPQVVDAARARAGRGTSDAEGADEAAVLSALGASSFHPRALKVAVAKRIVADFHSREAADKAEREFDQVFRMREMPSQIETALRPASAQPIWLPHLLTDLRLTKSNAEAVRMIERAAVSVNQLRPTRDSILDGRDGRSYVIRIGKKRAVQVRFVPESELSPPDRWISFLDNLMSAKAWARDLGVILDSRFDQYQEVFDEVAKYRQDRRAVESLPEFPVLVEGLKEGSTLIFLHKHLADLPREALRTRISQIYGGPVIEVEEDPTRASNHPRNIEFELLLASEIQAAGFTVDVNGPVDLRVMIGNQVINIECKRPQSLRAVGSCIADASRQLEAAKQRVLEGTEAGIVALSIGKALTGGSKLLASDSRMGVLAGLEREAEQFIRTNERAWQRKTDSSIDGILVHLSTVAHITTTNTWLWARFLAANNIASRGDPPAFLLKLCADLLRAMKHVEF